jgi:DNA polymerase I-like protein with 3'-5' exonuclease and polymerase domains
MSKQYALWQKQLPPWTDVSYIWDDVLSKRIVFFDFETTNLDKGSALNPDNDIVLATWIVREPDGTTTRKHKFGNEYAQQELYADVMAADMVVAHNAKFDLQWLARCGVDLRKIYASCTFLAAWVIDGNRPRPRNLNALAKMYGLGTKTDYVSALIKLGLCPSNIPRSWLLEYGMLDTELCMEVFLKQLPELDGMLHLLHVRNLTCLCLSDIETEGMVLDGPAVEAEWEHATEELKSTEVALRKVVGDEVNLNSPKQKVKLLYETLGFTPLMKREKGKLVPNYSTRSEVIVKLNTTTKAQQIFMELYRKYNKYSSLVKKNLTFFLGVVRERGAKFFAEFNQGRTATGRLSSSGRPLMFTGEKKAKSVQLQNVPRTYKRLFWSGDDDYFVGEADAAQLEFRVAAALGNDSVAIQEIFDGVDVHSVTAQVMTEAGEPTDRQGAKAITFSPLYGGNGKTPAQQEYAQFFRNKYRGISDEQRSWALEVLQNKMMVTKYGLKFYWPDTKLTNSGYITNSTEIYNFSVQGLATGEMIPIALVHFWYLTAGTNIRIINTIHDSIISVVHKDYTELYEQLSKFCFTDLMFDYLRRNYNYEFTCSLGCGIKVSRNWGQSETEVIYNVTPDGTCTRKVK